MFFIKSSFCNRLNDFFYHQNVVLGVNSLKYVPWSDITLKKLYYTFTILNTKKDLLFCGYMDTCFV